MDKVKRTRRGGPRTFNRDRAVDTAMRLFWRQGYEGTSLNDLTTAIGIAPPSLYAAFGSKAGLYKEALDRYAALPGALDGAGEAPSLNEAVERITRSGVRAVSNPSLERGCMISSGMIECSPQHGEIARDLTARRRAIREAIAAELSRWLDVERAMAVAGHLMLILVGLSVEARDGASADELDALANEAVAAVHARVPRCAKP